MFLLWATAGMRDYFELTTNGRPVLLNIQHRIAVITRIQWNIIDRLRTVAHHFQDLTYF